MANASNFYIGGNDEHGMNPPTVGKRTPVMPYVDRPFYENEFNRPAKNYFLAALARLGYRILDVKPEITDTSVSARVARVNRAGLDALVTFGYNAYGDGTTFNTANGSQVFYSAANPFAGRSRALASIVAQEIGEIGVVGNRGVGTLTNVGVLQSVNCISVLTESGFMTNFAEAKLMLDPDFQQAVGEKTAEGLSEYLGVEYFAPPDGTAYPLIRRGSRSQYVLYLQRLLICYGFDPGPSDGIFGANTERALKEFQTQNGLAADGIAGSRTWSLMLTAFRRSPLLRRGSRGLYVWYAQQKLLSKLYPAGSIDGIFGPNTEAAVKAFQTENGITADGIIGPRTWERLKVMGGGRQQP